MRLFLFLSLIIFSTLTGYSQNLIVNEVSQGPSGTKEYIELLVVPTATTQNCETCADLRGWIFDDNNGYFSNGVTTGTGVAAGACRFSNNSFWSCIPFGTIIVIYNNADLNASLPAQDVSMSDNNCRLIIPVNSNLIESQTASPNSTSTTYPTTGWVAGGALWSPLGMSNSDDSFQTYAPSNTLVPSFGISWGNNNSNNIIYFTGPASNTVYYFANTTSNNPSLQANWVAGTCSAPNDQTPGLPNNVANANFISQLTNTCSPILPLTSTSQIVPETCSCNGSVTITPSGAIPTYSYSWTDASNTVIGQSASLSNLCAGTYNCRVTSLNGCIYDTVIVIPSNTTQITPTFNPIGSFCTGATYSLPTTSTNGVTGTWSPAFNNQQTTNYTFTPSQGICANPVNITVTIDPCVVNQETCYKIVTFNQVTSSSCLVGSDSGAEDPALSIWCDNTLSTLLFGAEWTLDIPSATTINLPNPWNVCQQNNNIWNVGAIPNNVSGLNVFVQTYESDDSNCENTMTSGDDCTSSANLTLNLSLGTHTINIGGELSYSYTVTETNLISNVAFNSVSCLGNTYNASLTVTYINPSTPCGIAGSLGNLIVNGQSFPVTGSPQTISLTNMPANGLPVNINAYFDGNYSNCQYNASNVFTAPVQPSLISFSGGGSYCGSSVPGNILVAVNGTSPYTVNYTFNGQPNNVQSTTSPISLGNVAGTYVLTSINANGCQIDTVLSQTITISNDSVPTFNPLNPICVNGNAPSLPSSSIEGITGTWFPTTISTATVGNFNYTFSPSAAYSCATIISINVTITSQLTPIFPPLGPYCINSTPTLPTQSTQGITGTWNPSSINTSIANVGTYVFTPSNGFCSTTYSTTITVDSSVVFGGSDLSICVGDSVTLSATGTGPFTWNNNVTDGVSFTPTQSSIYTVSATQGGCTVTDNVNIVVNSYPIADFTFSPTSGLAPLLVTFSNQSQGSANYVWNFGNDSTLNIGTTVDVTTTYVSGGVYNVVLVANNNGCIDSISYPITVYENGPIEIPNVFSPNDDTVNDVYSLNLTFAKKVNAQILNRWGNVVYTITQVNQTWDGKSDGVDCVEGVYFLNYEITDITDKIIKGQQFIHLVR